MHSAEYKKNCIDSAVWLWGLFELLVAAYIVVCMLSSHNHNSIDPSWLPHVPTILYNNGLCAAELVYTFNRVKSSYTLASIRQNKLLPAMKHIMLDRISAVFLCNLMLRKCMHGSRADNIRQYCVNCV